MLLVFFMIFQKRPKYLIALPALLFLWIISACLGNNFAGFITLFLSCLFWCYFTVIRFISDENVKTNISGVELKEIVPISYFFLSIQALILLIAWMNILISPWEISAQMRLMSFVFFAIIVSSIICGYTVLAKLTIEFARIGVKGNFSAKSIFEDLAKLISNT